MSEESGRYVNEEIMMDEIDEEISPLRKVEKSVTLDIDENNKVFKINLLEFI